MPKTHLPFVVWTLLLATMSITVLSGCGGSAYESLTDRRLMKLRAGAPFKNLWGPTTIDETPYSVRLPLVFRKSFRPDSGHPDDKGRIKPDRFQPPFLQLPGQKLLYEGTASDGTGSLPFYCYLAVVPQGDAEQLQAEMQAALKEVFPETPDTWENVDAKTPEEKAVPWQKIRVTGEQPFYTSNSKDEPVAMPGIFELWVHKAEGDVVLIGWRTPTSIEGKTATSNPINPLLQLSSEGKLDMQAMPSLTAGTLEVHETEGEAG